MKVLLLLCAVVVAASASKIIRQLSGERDGQCPASSGMAGICVFIPGVNCISDSECPAGKKCCSEGCGRVCKTIVGEEVHAGSCPFSEGVVGICVVMPNQCSSDSACQAEEKCCPVGCGNHVCQRALHRLEG